METGVELVDDIKMAQIAYLAYDSKPDADGVATGIPLFEPFK